MTRDWLNDQELLQRCDRCHRNVSVFLLMTVGWQNVCEYCRTDPDFLREHPELASPAGPAHPKVEGSTHEHR